MDPKRCRVRIATASGRQVFWRKAGREHSLPAELGPTWIANFKSALFQVLVDGSIVPRGELGAEDIAGVELVPEEL